MEQNLEEGSQKQKCHLFQIMAIIGKKWTIAILQQIDINGYKGYNFMLKELGKISSKVLCERLIELENSSLIKRSVIADKRPVSTSYSLTEKGRDLLKTIDSLRMWNNKYYCEDLNVQCDKTICAKCKLY